jgi:hypothetical protein
VALRSLHFTGERREGGADHLFLSGVPLNINNSTLLGTSVTVRAAVVDLKYSAFVDCRFTLERGTQLFLFFSTVVGNAASLDSKPALSLSSGTFASVDTSRFENIHSVSSGAALLVVGSTLEVSDSHFVNCSSGGTGGAIHAEPLFNPAGEMRSSIQISSSSFSDCHAASSGGEISGKGSRTLVHVCSSSLHAGCAHT